MKYVGVGASIFMLLLFLLAGISQTRWFKNRALEYMVTTANKNLQGRLSAEALDGNLFNHMDISNIYMRLENDTILFLPELSVDFSLMELFRKHITIDSIRFSSPRLYVKDSPDRGWNINRMFRGNGMPEETGITMEHSQFTFTMNLKYAAVRNAQIHVESLNSPLPESIENLNTQFSGYYSAEVQQLRLIDLNFSTSNPEFHLEKFSFHLQRREELISLKNAVLQTGRNKMTAEGDYRKSSGAVALHTEPLDLTEFKVFLPDMNFRGNPAVTINTSLDDDSVAAEIGITLENQNIHLTGWFSGWREVFKNDSFAGLRYGLNAEINRVRMTEWINDFPPDITLNGSIHVAGKGGTGRDASVKLHADFLEGRYNTLQISNLTVEAEYLAGNLNSRMNLLGDFGKIGLYAKVTDLLFKQKYELNMDVAGLNLAKFIPETAMDSDLNFHLSARGEGLNFSRNHSYINLQAEHSILSGFHMDSLRADAYLAGTDININKMSMKGDSVKLRLAGKLSKTSENNFLFDLTGRNLAKLAALAGIDSLRGTGSLSANVRGQIDSLSVDGHLDLTNVAYHGNELESVEADINLTGNYHRFAGFINMNMTGITTPAMIMDRVTVQSDFTQDSAGIVLDITAGQDLEAHLKSQVKRDSVISISIPFVLLRFRSQQWSGGSPEMQIIYADTLWQVNNFVLNSSHGKSSNQEISANGIIQNHGPLNFHFTVEGLDLKDWSNSLRLPADLSGKMNLRAFIGGTAESPIIRTTFNLDSGSVNQITLFDFHGSALYQDRQLDFSYAAYPTRTDSLILEGNLPVNVSLAELPETFIPEETSLYIRLNTNGFPLSVFGFFSGNKRELNGNFKCNLVISGTTSQPSPDGIFQIANASYIDPGYGIDMQDMELMITLSSHALVLEKFLAKRDDGTLSASGKIDFNRDQEKISLGTLKLDLLANQFYLSRHRNQEIQLNGGLKLGGDLKNLQYNGDLTIPRASIYLPAFWKTGMNQFLGSNDRIPLLVKEQKKFHVKSDSLQMNMDPVVRQSKTLLDTLNIFENVSGTLKINANRNTWIKQSNMAVELSYALDISTKEQEPEIFGRIEILRGYYNLLGRRFNLKDSYIYFEGGKDLNPRLNIQIEYTFRTSDREQKTLKIYVRGDTNQPIILFSLDENEIEESVAFSYIIYGRSPEELSAGEQSDLNSSTNIMASYLSGQLGGAMGNIIGVDEFEINSADNWQSASVRMGKYLSPDLYVSYEQRFGEDREGDIIKKLVTLEYEISRNVLLQLVGGNDSYTGFDFIFKYIWE